MLDAMRLTCSEVSPSIPLAADVKFCQIYPHLTAVT